ncbi:MAG: PAS domain S-box protein [Nitrospirota bacterium]
MIVSLPRIASVTIMLIGGLVLLGWSVGITALTSLVPGWASMKPNTALAFILAGLSLWLSAGAAGVAGPRARLGAGVCAGLVAALGALTLSEYVGGWDLGLDRWLLTALHATDATDLGRMSYATAVSFLMVGATMILLNLRSLQAGWLIHLFILLIAMIAGLGLLRYLPGVGLISSVTFNGTMALHTTAGFLVLCAGIYRAHRDRAWDHATPGRLARSEGTPSRRAPQEWMDVVMIALVAVTLGLATVALQFVESHLIDKEGEGLAVTAANVADKLDRILYERYGDIQMLAQSPVFKRGDSVAISKHLLAMKKSYQYYAWLGMVDAQGRIVASTTSANLGEDRSRQDWFQAVRDHGGIHIQDAAYSVDAGGVFAVGFTAPVLGPGGEFLGAVTTRVSLPVLEQVFAGSVQEVERHKDFVTIEYQLMTGDGGLLVDSRLHQEGQVNLKRLGQPSALLSGRGEPGYIEEDHLRRHRPVVTGYASCKGYENFPGIPWGILVQMDRSAILAQLQGVMLKLGTTGALVLVPILGFLFWSTGRVKVECVAAQEESTRATAAEAKAQASEEEFRGVTQRLQLALKAGNAGLWIWNLKTNEIELSLSWKAQLGYTDEELSSRFEEFETRLHPDDRDRVLQGSRAFIENPVSDFTLEFRLCHKDGSYRWLFTRADLLRDTEGRPEWMTGCNIDITARKTMEHALRESQELFGSAFEFAPIGMALLALDGHWLQVNRALCDIVGYSEQELLKKRFQSLTPFDDWQAEAPLFQKLASGEIRSYYIEKRYVHKDGHLVWIQKSASLVSDDKGASIHFITQIQDITARKNAEEQSRLAQTKFRTLFESNSDAVMLLDVDVDRFLDCNKATLTTFGCATQEEFCSKSVGDVSPVEQPCGTSSMLLYKQRLATAIETGSHCFEWMHKRVDNGETFLTEVLLSGMRIDGKPVLQATVRDITERKRVEEALLKSERLNRNLVRHLPHRILVKDRDSVIVSCNANYAEDLGLSPSALIGKTAFEFYSSEIAEAYRNDDVEVMASGKTKDIEEPYQVDGEKRWVHTVKVPYRDEQQHVIGVLAVFEDITMRKQADEQFRTLLESSPDAHVIINEAGTITLINHQTEQLFGYTRQELLGQSIELLVPERFRQNSPSHPVGFFVDPDARSMGREMRALRKDGSEFSTEISLNPLEASEGRMVIAAIRDITKRLVLEQELIQAQKLESIGQLAAGIAHEINTPTQFVGDNIRFLSDSFIDLLAVLDRARELWTAARAGTCAPELIEACEAASQRADLVYLTEELPKALAQSTEGMEHISKIVRAMKDFSHPGSEGKTYVDLNKAIESTVIVACNEWKYIADLTTDLASDLPLVPCLLGQFNQVILNMIVNASHAIGDVVRGTPHKGLITITSRQVDHYAEIRITDTGTGIPEAIRHKIFDPFFTTKAVGKGTGQGLAIARSVVVDKHGGTIAVESQLGQGTTFIIRLGLTGSEDRPELEAAA